LALSSLAPPRPVLNANALSDAEQEVLGGFFAKCPLAIDDFGFFQCEVPICMQVVNRILAYNSESTVSFDEGFLRTPEKVHQKRSNGLRHGFLWEAEVGQIPSGIQPPACRIDEVGVTDDTVYLFEIKTSAKKISKSNDLDKPIGQIQSYTTFFAQDYPEISGDLNVKRWILTLESDLEMEFLEAVLVPLNIRFFDATRENDTLFPEPVCI
jgi:hypothetical protein